uniref:hypothetical protein n=1 Tax=Pseudomonas sp. MD330_10 TaxID=3241254 RepID=UPI0036D3B98C
MLIRVVHCAWLLLLARQSGLATVGFGGSVAGRPAHLQGIEKLVGLFINNLQVVGSEEPQLSIGQWLMLIQA